MKDKNLIFMGRVLCGMLKRKPEEKVDHSFVRFMSKVPTRYRKVLLRRYGFNGDMTLQEIADELKISRQAVLQIENRAFYILGKVVKEHI